MHNRYRIWVWLVLTAAPCFAADTEGKFAVADVGAIGCPELSAAMDRARPHAVGSDKYLRETQGFGMYLLGFKTGYNMSAPDTYDIFPDDRDPQALLARVDYYCRLHPKETFAQAVIAVAKNRHANRQRTAAAH